MWNCFCPVCFLRERSIFRVSLKSRYDDGQWEISREDLGVPRPPCGLLYISALHVQYGIQAFAKFKRPECARLHLREFQSQKISRRSMRPKLPRKVAVIGSPDGRHIATLYYISRPPLSQILRPLLDFVLCLHS